MTTTTLPLLPRDDIVFEDLPARTLILETVAPSVRDGLVVIEDAARFGIVVVRESRLAEAFAAEDGEVISGDCAVHRFSSWPDAVISAWRLRRKALDLVRPLMRGEDLYNGMHLEWTSFHVLLQDLRCRTGIFAVEIATDRGRGMTCIKNGRHIATCTDTHRAAGPPSLLDELAASDDGVITVRGMKTEYDADEDVAVHRDSADAIAWYITQKAGNDAEQTIFTAPFLFHAEDTNKADRLAETLPVREMNGAARFQLNRRSG
ncbi:MAG: hypothetical protein JOZ92_03605 [Candidatus Dormibacteraeota bacterium]|nr:hypothetical protein [Candidatus Dormibacteraeota bacterium]